MAATRFAYRHQGRVCSPPLGEHEHQTSKTHQ